MQWIDLFLLTLEVTNGRENNHIRKIKILYNTIHLFKNSVLPALRVNKDEIFIFQWAFLPSFLLIFNLVLQGENCFELCYWSLNFIEDWYCIISIRNLLQIKKKNRNISQEKNPNIRPKLVWRVIQLKFEFFRHLKQNGLSYLSITFRSILKQNKKFVLGSF